MNANEMADLMILFDSGRIYENAEEIATMLRQQQAEIEALKKEAALQRLSDFTQEAEKTLTDEEIMEIHEKLFADTEIIHFLDFARAILRKAQEK